MARKLTLGANKEEVIQALVKYAKTHSLPLSKARLSDAYDVAEKHTDWYGPPNTLWGTVAGLTQSSQSIQFADERSAVDRAAGRLMQMAF